MKDEKVNNIKFWIARDKTSDIFLYFTKPYFCGTIWYPQKGSYAIQMDTDLFPEVTFENSPKRINLFELKN